LHVNVASNEDRNGLNPKIFDIFIMIHSDLFIQNPESTFSKTVCIIRAVLGLQTIPLLDRIGESDADIYTDPHHWASCSLIYHYIDTHLHNNYASSLSLSKSATLNLNSKSKISSKLKPYKKHKKYTPPVAITITSTNININKYIRTSPEMKLLTIPTANNNDYIITLSTMNYISVTNFIIIAMSIIIALWCLYRKRLFC
jgi:hypothetical protein